ncbi:MAG: type II secretion system protein [Armatimonadetes bacterium]|nr:type II secretion system protein [Armatimonadota bacterium]
MRSVRGFTLIELLAVNAIVAILAAVLCLPNPMPSSGPDPTSTWSATLGTWAATPSPPPAGMLAASTTTMA